MNLLRKRERENILLNPVPATIRVNSVIKEYQNSNGFYVAFLEVFYLKAFWKGSIWYKYKLILDLSNCLIFMFYTTNMFINMFMPSCLSDFAVILSQFINNFVFHLASKPLSKLKL